MKRVLVTGANGFVGRRLCAHLSRHGWHVRAAIRTITDSGLEPNCEIHQVHDIGPDTDWLAAVSGMDAVVHLAARVHVMRDTGMDSLQHYRRINTEGTLSLAQASARAQVSRFVFLSTIKVNGERTVDAPFTEADDPHPTDPYSISKLEAELRLDELSLKTGLQTVIFRPPLIYGPGVKGNFLRLMSLIRRRVPLPLASITNARSLLCVDNLVSAINAVLDASGNTYGTYLISDDHDLSTPELIEKISKSMGLATLIFRCPPGLLHAGGGLVGKGDEVRRMIESLRVDCSLFKQKLNWCPVIHVDAGIAGTTQAYQHSILKNPQT